ncbi:putative DNA polymerase, partial [Aphelenchoides avenae]
MPTHRRYQRGGADDEQQRAARRERRRRNREENGTQRRPHIVNTYKVDDLTLEQLLERHVEVVGDYVRHVHKFKVDGYQTKFVLKNLDEADNPVRVLERTLDWMMETATTNATEADYEVTDIGVAFRVDGMNEDFLVPFRPPEENNAQKVSQAIDDYDQSEKDGEPISIYNKEMDLRITLVKRPVGAGHCPFVDDEAECSDEDNDHDNDDEDYEEGSDEDVVAERELEEQGLSVRPRQRNPNNATGDAAELVDLSNTAKRRRGRKRLQYVPGLSIVESALIRMPKYDDNYCLFYAIAVARLYSICMKKNAANRATIAYSQTQRLSKNHQRLKDEALTMMWNADIQQGQRTYGLDDVSKVQEYFNRAHEGLFRLVIFGERSGHKTLFNGGVNAKNNLFLYHNNGHFDVMKSPAQFFDRKYYCVDCEAPFSKVEQHTIHCRVKCAYCLRMGHEKPCKPDGVTHEYCFDCIASYDFEAEIHKQVARNKKQHEPNYVSVHITCTDCIANGTWEDFKRTDCKICGPKKHWKIGAWELPEDRTVVDALLELLLNNLPKGHPTYAYAHNASKYDVHFTLKGICEMRGIRPKITSVGNKIMEMRIAKTKNFNKVIFRDSLLLFPMKLDDCPKTFDLRRNGCLLEGKSRFPYAYNRAENYGVRRESLPPSTDYLPVKMSKEEKATFMEWYNAHRNEPFDLCEALADYCSNDTLILIYAL